MSGSGCALSVWPPLGERMGESEGGWWYLSQTHNGVSHPFFLPPTIKVGSRIPGRRCHKGDCCLSRVESPCRDHANPLGGLKPPPPSPMTSPEVGQQSLGRGGLGNPVCSMPLPLPWRVTMHIHTVKALRSPAGERYWAQE